MDDYTVLCNSCGKDSMATLILCHENGIKVDEVLISMPWYDKERGIYAVRPDQAEWIMQHAVPKMQSMGYKVTVLSGERDMLYHANKTIKKSKNPNRIGGYSFPFLVGRCGFHGEKFAPINRYIRDLKKTYTVSEIVGIAYDEPKRFARLKEHQRSVLYEMRVMEEQTYDICRGYDLLSPRYESGTRDGCFFCGAARPREMAELMRRWPELYEEYKALLLREKNLLKTVCFIPIEDYIAQAEMIANQISLFDLGGEGCGEKPMREGLPE